MRSSQLQSRSAPGGSTFILDELSESSANDDSSSSSSSSSSSDKNIINDQGVRRRRSAETNSSSSDAAFGLDSQSDGDNESRLRLQIIAREERHVRKARWAVATAILVCSTVLSWAVYAFAKRAEYRSFKVEYELFAEEIRKLVQWEVQYNFALMQSLSASVTAAAIMTESAFPNVTMPFFEITGGYVDGLGGIMAAAFAPLVKGGSGSVERVQWEAYSKQHKGWMAQAEQLRQVHPGHRDPMHGTNQDHEHDRRRRRVQESAEPNAIFETIFRWVNATKVSIPSSSSQTLFAPLWQVSPPDGTSVNADLLSEPLFVNMFQSMIATNYTVLSPATTIGDTFDFLFDESEKPNKRLPHAFIMEPVYSAYDDNSTELVGMVIALTTFGNLLDRLLPENGANGVSCVITDACGNTLTYELDGPKSAFLGYSDLHDATFDAFRRSFTMEHYEILVDGLCSHQLHVYPSSTLRASYDTYTPIINASMVFLAFLVTSLWLAVYDKMVSQRQERTMRSALRSGALVAKMFPSATLRDRVMDVARDEPKKTRSRNSKGKELAPSAKAERFRERPIAEFYPATTLLFADIAGFTSWASAREPFQVFQLLETIFGAFDDIAKRRRIFKVETVGDCYVAVCGIPIARADHAVVMSRFARDCMLKMSRLIKELEVEFGPDTSSLQFRIGLHSGPVTGGVLRGENARFQLFGDTMNTAARMESTGVPSRIQVSQATADLLVQASKDSWIIPRDEVVNAKGKGELQTYWLVLKGEHSDAMSSSDGTSSSHLGYADDNDNSCDMLNGFTGRGEMDAKTTRLIDWNTDVLLRLLAKVVASRDRLCNKGPSGPVKANPTAWQEPSGPRKTNVIDEVAEFIVLLDHNGDSSDKADTVISDVVKEQLRDYVHSIASLYRKNPFHNFEHASHVAMSVGKLLGRIVAPATEARDDDGNEDCTFGITSDPLTQFACVFSALIHDVDHSGVPNAQLVQEQAPVAVKYNNQSVAEQNSLDIAWSLLLEDRFADLRATLCATIAECERFRQLVVNAVMATDIMAPDLKQRRNERWNKVFMNGASSMASPECSRTLLPNNLDSNNEMKHRKATIVIEHLLQASDVSHTMQHWHIYRQWNERLFQEQYLAYQQGRSADDPANGWYAGELGFMDHYIIPLAKKLAQCGVFGVCSDEYLTYALQNRAEWQARGREIVAEMREQVRVQYMPQSPQQLQPPMGQTQEQETNPLHKPLFSSAQQSPLSDEAKITGHQLGGADDLVGAETTIQIGRSSKATGASKGSPGMFFL